MRAAMLSVLVWGSLPALAAAGTGDLKLQVTATIHCLGVRVRGVGQDTAGASVRFRAKGQARWQEALPLVVALGNKFADTPGDDETAAAWLDARPIIRRLHGSIFRLQPDTAYEVQATLLDAAGRAAGTLSATARTLPDQVTYGTGRTLNVGRDGRYKTIAAALEAARPGDTVLVAPGVYKEPVNIVGRPSGEPGKPVTLRGQKGAILDGDQVPKAGDVHAGLAVRDAHDLIVEGFLVRRYGYCMFINGCRRVVVQKNYIDLTLSQRSAPYGIRMKRCSDSLLQLNCAREPKLGEHHYARYPFSIDGGHGNVIRYNQMLGGACHDILTTRNNYDTDIYENVLRGQPADDGVEIEGGACINVRFFDNLVDCPQGAKAALSLTPVTVGPVYVLRNVFACSRQAIKFANDGTANALKAGHGMCDFAPLLLHHNVFYNPKEAFFRFLGCHGRPILINNILCGKPLPDVTKNLRADRATNLYAKVEADYNVCWDGGRTAKSPTPGLDAHSLFADPLLVAPEKGNFTLREDSPAIDRALPLPNVNDTFTGRGPDIGCFEFASDRTGRTLKEPLKDDPR